MSCATIIGDGAWGTALALVLLRNGRRVRIWSPFPEHVHEAIAAGENRRFLPGIPLPPELEWTDREDLAMQNVELVVVAVPSGHMDSVLRRFVGRVSRHALYVSVTKGLHPTHLWRMTETIERIWGVGPVVALSGPSFAVEVAQDWPTAVVAACRDHGQARAVQQWFVRPSFRVYTSDDVIGVELGGALKNVIAIAAGVCDGLGLGANAKAALVTRGLAEMTRLAVAAGAHPATLSGLSGVGDLMLTCYGHRSRNRNFGERIGRGECPAEILKNVEYVVEGVTNCDHAARLAEHHGVQMPIAEAVRDVVHGRISPAEAVARLLQREPKPERG